MRKMTINIGSYHLAGGFYGGNIVDCTSEAPVKQKQNQCGLF